MKKGFTILELLVVISVLVILIGIAIPRFKGMQDAGRVAQAKAELRTMQTAIESYYMNQSTPAYPADNTQIATVLTSTGAGPQIIGAALVDPFSSTSRQYNYQYTSPYYVISSVGVSGSGTASVTSSGVTASGGALCKTNAPTGC